jgi:hypothetical protein
MASLVSNVADIQLHSENCSEESRNDILWY